MRITESDRRKWALNYLQKLQARLKEDLEYVDDVKLREVIVARNEVAMALAGVEQQIRKIKEEEEACV